MVQDYKSVTKQRWYRASYIVINKQRRCAKSMSVENVSNDG